MPSSPSPSPISVYTSEAWDSDGAGLWSTFIVEVRSPAQPARVLISTTSGETWVVGPEGCPEQYGPTCVDDRGLEFNENNSTTWSSIGLFQLNLESNLGYEGNAAYGCDTVALGYPGSGGPQLQNMVVAGIASPDFWLGHFGVDPAPSNFTNLNDPQPSFLETLFNTSMIPSRSWACTAGASYRYNKVPGSLTLGGYDTSRFTSNDVSFDLYPDVARRLIVDLVGISYTQTASDSTAVLMSEKIPMFMDSTIPYIYLPTSMCDEFEKAFGLQWNETIQLYTIDDTTHSNLQTINPNITFTLANTAGQSQNITLPYQAFDLTATFPVVQNNMSYFPLKRATNESQYTLGRVFMQEAYLISDFERSTFSVSQCVWPPSFEPNIVEILPVKGPGRNATGAIAGGVVGGVVVLIVVIFLGYFFIYKPRRKASSETGRTSSRYEKPELDAEGVVIKDTKDFKAETNEISGQPVRRHEIASLEPAGYELDSPQIFEMPAREPIGSELSSALPSPRTT